MVRLFVAASLAALVGGSLFPPKAAAQDAVQIEAIDQARPDAVTAKATAYLPAELVGSIERYQLGRGDPQSPPLIRFFTKPEKVGRVCTRKLYIRYDRGDAERPAHGDPLVVHDELSYASGCGQGGKAQFAQVVSGGADLAWARQALSSYLAAARQGSPSASIADSRHCFRSGQPKSCNSKAVSTPPLFGAEQLRLITTAPGQATLIFASSPTSNYVADVEVRQDRGGRSKFTVQQHPGSPG